MSCSGSRTRNADQMTLVNSQQVDVVLLSVTWAPLIGVGLALAPNEPPAAARRAFTLRELLRAGGQAEEWW